MIKFIFLTVMIAVAFNLPAQEVDIFTKDLGEGKLEVWIKNNSFTTHTVKVDIEQSGMTQDTKTPVTRILKGNTSEKIATLTPKPNKSYGYRLKKNAVKGNALAKHDDTFIYQLPYPRGKTYRVDQGYNGKTTHENKNALDFNLPEGSEICAIRAGIVFELEEKNKRGCPRQECVNLSNFIVIEHEDGSLANYAHLKKNGVLLEVGDKVSAGEVIGLSGETGWASGPHLHLEIYTISWDDQRSIPAKYHLNDSIIVPKEGQFYTR
ncbi:MAG: murein DD-endopeptidase MepM/ murein hydrolase activator NlpD [Cyclobacteriaceae bacterium]|jgi:murein DD-endopeptidase MepM/ murein hydrolase activator NlpD